MPYDEYIKRGDPPTHDPAPGVHPLTSEEAQREIIKAPPPPTAKRYSAVSKRSRRK